MQGSAPGDMHAAFRNLNLQRGPSLDDSSSSSDEDEATFGRQAASRPTSLKVHSGLRVKSSAVKYQQGQASSALRGALASKPV